jgi:hypothetical protein
MKRLFFTIFLLFILACNSNLYAQDQRRGLPNIISDSLGIGGQDTVEIVAEMPVYNPLKNAISQIFRPPENTYYNMPIIGQKDTTHAVLYGLPGLGKKLPEQWPGDVDKYQKADSTESK